MVLPGIMNTPLWEIPLDPSNIQRIWDSLSPEQKKFYQSKQIFITTYEQANFLVKTVNGIHTYIFSTILYTNNFDNFIFLSKNKKVIRKW